MGEASATSFPNYGLQWCLGQLGKEEFQMFKMLLKGNASELATGSFPWVEVDDSSTEHLASILHEHCRASLVWKVCTDIFHKMNLPMLFQKARDEMEKMPEAMEQNGTTATEGKDPGHGHEEWVYKCHVMRKFAGPLGTRPGSENFALDWQRMQTLSRVFTPDQQGFRPRTVVLHGRAGVGKSTLARRILLHWAHGELYPGLFSYVFIFDARDIPSRRKSSFAELIFREWPDSVLPAAKIFSRPERLLFVVDGFDDLSAAFQSANVNLCADWTQQQEVSVLIRSLLKKVLLPESSLIVTIRDVGVEKLKAVVTSPHYLFVEGISVERRVQLFLEHIKDEEQKMQLLHSVVDNHMLIEMCQVSSVGSLLCQALELQMASGKGPLPSCQVLTGLYTTFMVHQLTPQDAPGRGLSPEERVVLKGLCRMAVQGIWAMKFVFYPDDLSAHGLTELELSSLFRRNVLVQDTRGDRCFTFLHPSLQEFYAALYYVLEGPETEWCPHPLYVKNMKTLKELRQVSFNVHLLQMKRFLFGLMNQKLARTLKDSLGCPLALGVKRVLLRWVSLLGQPADAASALDFLDAFYCLFEAQDEEFVRVALNGFQDVRLLVSRPMDLLVSSFCVQHCQNLQKIRMDVREIFSEDESTEAQPVVLQGLQIKPLVSKWWENLCSVLCAQPSLLQLDLSSSILSEWAMKTLCVKLRQPACRVQKLIFKGIHVTLGLHHLWKTLVISPTIKHVNLESTRLKEEDIRIASEALKHPNCVLESLRLDNCGLTQPCCLLLSQILQTSSSLRSLSLAGNAAAGQNMEPLCDGMKVSQCALQKLVLGNCGLTGSSCWDLALVLCSNQKLTHLDVSTNRLGAEGVTALCRALKRVNCALQRLILRECNLDILGCSFLALALTSNRHLTHLNLSMNPLGDDGIHFLCEVLAETSCHLQDLELMKCCLTSACCKNLCAVITQNKHLRSLDLAANALGDTGVTALCEGLKQRTTRLRRLGLEACGLTADCCEALASALLSNQHLSSLNLMRNKLTPEGIKKLCPAFEHPTSNLQNIGLWKWQYPSPTRKLLEKVQALKPYIVIGDGWYSFHDDDDRYWWKTEDREPRPPTLGCEATSQSAPSALGPEEGVPPRT
ncbi:NACHT, LRR and PYD domains-containing protein 5 [Sturnira hondurensis]|uniref:NACHT, LRR and PYD domains-containing protein 5 n=1 Tax=Sturnira hondurensis TaxID=192404 RepID=UPI0018799703|nr:NACHT, LRR and PYD domains-containing protein 5 [Sturnira hondurensis]